MKRSLTVAASVLLGCTFMGSAFNAESDAYQGSNYSYNKQTSTKRTRGSWVKENGHFKYYNRYGKKVYGWAMIDGVQYYFDMNGYKVSGVVTIDGVSYEFDSYGAYVGRANSFSRKSNENYNRYSNVDHKNSYVNKSYQKKSKSSGTWVSENGKYKYYNRYGKKVYGWAKIDGVQYYFNENGYRVSGVETIDGVAYQFASSGAYLGKAYSEKENNDYSEARSKKSVAKYSNEERNGYSNKIDNQKVEYKAEKSYVNNKKNYDNEKSYKKENNNKEEAYVAPKKTYAKKSQESTQQPTRKASKGSYSGKRYISNASAYAGDGTTASGQKPRWGTIAVDPSIIPLGSRVYIPYFDKVFIANDTGGIIKGTKIDVFMNSESQANDFGRRNLEIIVLD